MAVVNLSMLPTTLEEWEEQASRFGIDKQEALLSIAHNQRFSGSAVPNAAFLRFRSLWKYPSLDASDIVQTLCDASLLASAEYRAPYLDTELEKLVNFVRDHQYAGLVSGRSAAPYTQRVPKTPVSHPWGREEPSLDTYTHLFSHLMLSYDGLHNLKSSELSAPEPAAPLGDTAFSGQANRPPSLSGPSNAPTVALETQALDDLISEFLHEHAPSSPLISRLLEGPRYSAPQRTPTEPADACQHFQESQITWNAPSTNRATLLSRDNEHPRISSSESNDGGDASRLMSESVIVQFFATLLVSIALGISRDSDQRPSHVFVAHQLPIHFGAPLPPHAGRVWAKPKRARWPQFTARVDGFIPVHRWQEDARVTFEAKAMVRRANASKWLSICKQETAQIMAQIWQKRPDLRLDCQDFRTHDRRRRCKRCPGFIMTAQDPVKALLETGPVLNHGRAASVPQEDPFRSTRKGLAGLTLLENDGSDATGAKIPPTPSKPYISTMSWSQDGCEIYVIVAVFKEAYLAYLDTADIADKDAEEVVGKIFSTDNTPLPLTDDDMLIMCELPRFDAQNPEDIEKFVQLVAVLMKEWDEEP